MNLIFKIIWNKTTQRLEVVSELAKGAVKASSTSSSEKNNKTLPISILATLVTSILASSVSYAAKINYEDIPKQGVVIVYDADSGILRNMSLEGTENLGVLSATDAVNSLNRMLARYKGFVHVNSEGNKANKTGIWADWLTANDSKVKAEGKNPGAVFSDNLGRFTEKSGAQGMRSVAVGVYTNALATDSIAIGSRANVNNFWGSQYREAVNGIAIGKQAQVEGSTGAIAFGAGSTILRNQPYNVGSDNAIAIGNDSKITAANGAIAIGNRTNITAIDTGVGNGAVNAIAIGNGATVERRNSIALGQGTKASGVSSIALGDRTTVSRENTVAIGTNVTAKRENSVVIGQNAKGERERVVAIGAYATAVGDRTVAIGSEATANGSKSIVIGGLGDDKTDGRNFDKATSADKATQAIVIGNGAQATDSASYSITLGNSAKTEAATGISIGDRAKVASGATSGIALGKSAVANNSGDIAIGQSSSTSTKHAVSDMKIGDITLSKGVVATDNSTVSFGNSNIKRQIQNVGAGEISATSSDVITGSQLYSVIKATDEIAKTEYKFTVGDVVVKTMRNNEASSENNKNNTLNFNAEDGLSVEAGSDGSVIYKLNADSKQAITDAKNAAQTVTTKLNEINQSVARAETAADKAETAKAEAENAKDAAKASEDKAKASENNVKIIENRIENSGLISKDGKTAFAADNTSGRNSAKASGKDSTAMGYGSEAKGDHSTALGNNAKAHADRSTAIGHNAEAKAVGSVALGEGSVAKEENTISVGDVGHERRITNVQDPKNLTDAANKRYVDYSVNSVRNELKQTDRKLRGGIAGVVAMANIPTTNRAGRTMIGVGVGNFKGQNAVAVGLSKSSDNNRIHFKVSGSATSAGDYAIGGGIGYQW
ncbi:YadA-like family protein [Haemophilus influenzae]|uniref:YadA-like family protein n=1 Tax=Haemophilus influenzae TaxID=727 RepID=UPI000D00FB81|nr:YadA-like family protein [Haemophilus influenzae]PRI47503.1 Hep/Hag repeat protein [Haemophilus influenzae]PRM44652.1 Hep/Hag repeat protein [Haemophilus influenzae]